MDLTSDDPVTIAIVAGSAFSAYSASQNKPGSPPVANPAAVQSSGVEETRQKKDQKRRQSMMASVLTKDWDKPMLSESGLLGIS